MRYNISNKTKIQIYNIIVEIIFIDHADWMDDAELSTLP